MSLPNPTVNVPRLTSRPQRHSHSSSPSHSPVRQALDYDPLLSDLTPTKTLGVFTDHNSNDRSIGGKHDSAVYYGLEGVSPSERALGTRAAQICITLRAWCRELESWEWPDTFDLPEPARTRAQMRDVSMEDMFMVPTSDGDREEHWGSLAARTVQAYDRRIDEICRDLDSTDVEQLKDYVLTAHQASGGSIDDSFNALGRISDLRQLDDFTAIVTATILQALPFLSRIHMLLDIWTIRLSILRQTPQYLRDLKYVRVDLDHGWAAIASSYPSNRSAALFTLDTMHELQDTIQHQIKSLAQRLDGFLDELEGSAETLPESWIEEFEDLEAAYVDWVVQAERRIIENQWRSDATTHETGKQATRRQSKRALAGRPLERTHSLSYAREIPVSDADAVVSPSSRSTSVISMLPHDESESFEPYVDPHASVYGGEIAEAEKVGNLQQAEQSDIAPNESIPPRQSRGVPIVTAYDEHSAQPPPAVGSNGSVDVHKALPPPPQATESTEQEQPPVDNVARMRAAFLNGELEQPKSLRAQVKSPVRPFERATNAFTQLFRRDKTPELGRSSSSVSDKSRQVSKSGKFRQSQEIDSARVADGEETVMATERGNQSLALSPGRQSKMASWRRSSGSQRLPDRGVTHETDTGHVLNDTEMQSHTEDLVHQPRPLYTPEEDSEGEERQLGMVDRPPPETYKPTRLETRSRPETSSHHQECEYPADWPLASPPATEPPSPAKEGRTSYSYPTEEKTLPDDDFPLDPVLESRPTSELKDNTEIVGMRLDSEPEIKTPKPLRTSDFDRLFVYSFPAVSDVEEIAVDTQVSPRKSGSKRRKWLREPVVGEDMLHDTFSLRSNEREDKRESTVSLGKLGHQAREMGTLGGRSLEAAADRQIKADIEGAESDEVLDIGPQWVRSKSKSSDDAPKQKIRPKSMPAKVPGSLKLKIPGLRDDLITAQPAAGDENVKPGHISRASIASIDSVPRSQVKTIELSRRRSDASMLLRSHPSSPPDEPSNPVSPIDQHDIADTMPYKGLVTFPSPPPGPRSLPMSPVSPIVERDSDHIRVPRSRFAAGSAVMQVRDSTKEPSSSPHAESNHPPASPQLHNAKRRGPQAAVSNSMLSRDGGDHFDRHVSEVLERLPSQSIRFRSRPGAETPEPAGRTSELRSHRGTRPKSNRIGPPTAGSMTIAPAEASSRKTESEIKLYHLTQADNDQPIKLFVRIVGEGERVMVRVGGGWQDLAEFLRQFATHHGSRTASGGALEVVTTDSPGSRKVSNSAVTNAKTAGPSTSTVITPTQPSVHRPTSRMDARRDDDDWLSQPQPVFSMGDDSRPTTADGSPASFHYTPIGSRPATADSAKRPTSAAGKKIGLDEHKSRWVDDMIEKARMSAEKSKEERVKYFGDLGRAGGTRRVVFRASSAAEGPEENKG